MKPVKKTKENKPHFSPKKTSFLFGIMQSKCYNILTLISNNPSQDAVVLLCIDGSMGMLGSV